MINCNQNENDNGKVDHINKKNVHQDVDIEKNIENILVKLSNTETESKKSVDYIKKRILFLYQHKHLGKRSFMVDFSFLKNIFYRKEK